MSGDVEATLGWGDTSTRRFGSCHRFKAVVRLSKGLRFGKLNLQVSAVLHGMDAMPEEWKKMWLFEHNSVTKTYTCKSPDITQCGDDQ
jgi:hypothetical protein